MFRNSEYFPFRQTTPSSTLLLCRTTRYIIDFYPENNMLRFNVRGVRSIDGATRAAIHQPESSDEDGLMGVPVTPLAAGGLTFTFLLE
jgi:hypothetical protein